MMKKKYDFVEMEHLKSENYGCVTYIGFDVDKEETEYFEHIENGTYKPVLKCELIKYNLNK